MCEVCNHGLILRRVKVFTTYDGDEVELPFYEICSCQKEGEVGRDNYVQVDVRESGDAREEEPR